VDAAEAVLESVQHVQASARLAFTTKRARGAVLELPRLVRLAPEQLARISLDVVEQAMELALLVPAGASAIHHPTVWDAVAPILESARSVRLAALDITSSVVKGARTELARHALRQQPGITQMAALEPTLESLLYVPPAVAGNSTLTAAVRAVARAQHAHPAQLSIITQAALGLLMQLAFYAQVTSRLVITLPAAAGRVLAHLWHAHTRAAPTAHLFKPALEHFRELVRHAQATRMSDTTRLDAVAAILDTPQPAKHAALDNIC